MGIVVNACRDRIKEDARRRQRHEAKPLVGPSEESNDEKTELIAAVLKIVKGLPERYRHPVSLHFLDGLSFKEIACALALPEDTVAQQSSRGIEQIRRSLGAAGFTAVVVPEVLASFSMPSVPAHLAGSFTQMIASAAVKDSGAATGAATANSAVAATSTKVVVTAALLLAAVMATFYICRGKETKQDAEGPPTISPTTPKVFDPTQTIDNSLAEILDRKMDVAYRRDYLSEVLDDLDKRIGLRSAFPKPIDKTFMFTLEEKLVSVRTVLERLAADGKLNMEFHGDEVVFWKKVDDSILAGLEQKLKNGDVEARCEAVYDLAQLGDKRIFPLLLVGLCDKNQSVIGETISVLEECHNSTLFYAMNKSDYFEPLSKLLSATGMGPFKTNVIMLLGDTRDTRAVERLAALLEDADATVRSNAARALGNTRSPHAIELLTGLLKQPDRELRFSAADALSNARDPRTFDALVDFLSDVNARESEPTYFGNTRDPRAFNLLLRYLKDADVNVRISAIDALGKTRDPRAFEPLVELLKDTNARSVRSSAAYALGKQRDPRAFELLIPMLKDADALIRRCAFGALSSMRDSRMLDRLIAIASDATDPLRPDAIEAVGNMRDPRAIETLAPLLKEIVYVQAAAHGLAQIQDRRAVEVLIACLKDPDLVGIVAYPLSQMQDPKAIDALTSLLKETDVNRFSAACVLWKIRNPRGFESLLGMSKDVNPSVRFRAVEAIQLHWEPRGEEPLITLLGDADQGVRFMAVRGLAPGIDDRGVLDPVIARLKDADAQVQNYTVWVLGQSRDPRAKAALANYENNKAASVKPAEPKPAKSSPASDF